MESQMPTYIMYRIRVMGLRHWVLVNFMTCLFLLFLRSWCRLMSPDLWAEDGNLFFTDAYELEINSLIQPYAGYYHTLPRLLAYAFSFLPISIYPQLIFLSSLFTCAAVSAQFSRPAYRWLMPSDAARLGLCLAMCVAPGLYEVLGNLANLHNLLMVYLGFVILRDLRVRLSLKELFAVFLALGSEGACIVLLPALVARLALGWQTLSRRSDLITAIMLIVWTMAHSMAINPNTATPPRVLDVLYGIFQVVPERLVLLPLLGARNAIWSIRFMTFLICGWAIILYAIFVSSRRLRWKFTIPALVVGSAFALYVATWIVRSDGFLAFTKPSLTTLTSRYAYVSFPYALVVWGVFLSSIRVPARSRNASIWIFFGMVSLLARQPSALGPVYGGGQADWPQVSARLEEVLHEHSCVSLQFPSAPPGWLIVYRPPASACGNHPKK
jgi:hypothetical protein